MKPEKQEEQLGKLLAVYPALFSIGWIRSLKAWHDTVRRPPAYEELSAYVEGHGALRMTNFRSSFSISVSLFCICQKNIPREQERRQEGFWTRC